MTSNIETLFWAFVMFISSVSTDGQYGSDYEHESRGSERCDAGPGRLCSAGLETYAIPPCTEEKTKGTFHPGSG